ncbi:hypothetical protein [Pseudomonas sp. SDO558_S425]
MRIEPTNVISRAPEVIKALLNDIYNPCWSQIDRWSLINWLTGYFRVSIGNHENHTHSDP